ncbi:hypothetical protein Bca4012_077030 [Brassica carinata]|uniref:Uncharacterized protein n=1 Tax=Brassica carinata TaxID=52824 RepID=A0A8X7Q8I5_BRACI|nr:hypothetical protein Bca52824_072703 [Brassica carinata]
MEEIVEVVIQTEVVIKTKMVTEVEKIVEEVTIADMKMMMEVVIEGGIVIMKCNSLSILHRTENKKLHKECMVFRAPLSGNLTGSSSVGWGGGVDHASESTASGNKHGWQWYEDPRLDCLGYRSIFPSDATPPLFEADKETDESSYLLWRLEHGPVIDAGGIFAYARKAGMIPSAAA